MSKTWYRSTLVICVVAVAATTSYAQRGQGGFGGRGGGGFGGFGGGFGRGGDTIGFILREDVQQELGLSKADLEDLRKVVEAAQQESGELRREMFGNFRDLSQDEREKAATEMAQKTEEIAGKARKAVASKLSSKQKQRYAELEFQYLLQQGNLIAALQAADIKPSSSVQAELTDAMRDVREEIRKRTEQITRELYADVIGKVANADVDKLTGKAFTFENTGPQFGRGGPGGPGGARGARGGRTRGGGEGGENTTRPTRPSGESNPRRAR